MATQATQQTPYYAEIAVKYDGLKNDGSTVVAADVAIGDTVTIKDALDTDGTMLVCRPETATLENTKFLVTDVSPTVNQITTGTTRRGGIIKVAPWKSITGIVQASVANGVNAADALLSAPTARSRCRRQPRWRAWRRLRPTSATRVRPTEPAPTHSRACRPAFSTEPLHSPPAERRRAVFPTYLAWAVERAKARRQRTPQALA
jgi:hypothetical protein